ncbi:protein AF-9 isoform X2 [Spea bombifrons]|uniref:protein AF-9 isoform X2 n=1 Tax=Spea bombifrons TaxID=233779 RepID=UPI002349764A|nr:protein AF-9 isoform X2 [Spea bombifrons]
MCAVQVKLELGHRAQVRKKPTLEGFTHDWMVFVRGPEHSNIQHFVEKVVFHLHESFPRPKRVCKDPPYKVEESGYAGFILPIEVYFKNKEEPKKVRFDYDLFLHLEGHPPVNHLRCEKLTFNNPTEEFRRKLLKAGGIMVMSEGSSFSSGTSLHLPSLPSNSLSFSDAKKCKPSHGSKDPNKLVSINTSSNTSSSSVGLSKPHKSSKEHKEKSSKDSKEHRSAFKEPSREHTKSSKDSSKKPKENKPLKDEKIVPKMVFKEPKPMSKESRCENNNILTVSSGHQQEKKLSSKRPPHIDSEDPLSSKKRKSSSDSSLKGFSNSSLLTLSSEKKPLKDKSQPKPGKVKVESEVLDKKKVSLPPFEDIVDPNDTDIEDNMSSKSESGQPSPASSSSSSSSSLAPPHNHRQGSLRSIMKDLHSDENDDESDDAEDNDSENERTIHMHGGSRARRISLSDGSNSESSSVSSPLRNDPPTLLKTNNNQILEVKSPIKQNKSDKQIKNGDCDKAYLDELVELHRRLMTLRERHVLQQIVNLIEETGHFHITNTTFDFDLCSLDKTTVRKLQSYLETSGAS